MDSHPWISEKLEVKYISHDKRLQMNIINIKRTLTYTDNKEVQRLIQPQFSVVTPPIRPPAGGLA